ncbi:MAG: class I SAM-dependent methyltransferase [Thermacetogeniaceae bacterium]
MDIREKWDELHNEPRFCPVYPSEIVVQWTFRNFPRSGARNFKLLDLGCGAGRHSIFLAREGYAVTACDFSEVGIREARRRADREGLTIETFVSEADNLNVPDQSFDGVICCGVLNYLPMERFYKTVDEIHRALKPGGKALVVTRTPEDSRRRHAKPEGPCTYRIMAVDEGSPSGVEVGMTQTLIDYENATTAFAGFPGIIIDRNTVTQNNGSFINDDWLIQVQR